ncbi:MAG: hypothetical protein WC590_00515 [Burkholderiaceae bacterium]
MRGMVLAAGVLAVAIAGCASKGVQESDKDFPTASFTVDTDYEAAYRRASEFLRVCWTDAEHRYGVRYEVLRNVDRKGTLGTLSLTRPDETHRSLMLIESEPIAPRQSKVTVTVLGQSPWDERQIEAARQSIITATPVCTPAS